MAQIMVFEPDEIATTALKKTFAGDTEVKLVFLTDMNDAMEMLNGNPIYKAKYEKLKAATDSARQEFQSAADAEVGAKGSYENAKEIIEKLKSEQESSKEPTPEKKELENEINVRTADLKNLGEVRLAATKLKAEKEKIFSTNEAEAEVANADIPGPADQVYGVLLIASQFAQPKAQVWLEQFRKSLSFEPNKMIRIVILGFDAAEKTVKKFLVPGISDYMIKPVDELLARQNLKFLALGANNAKREVYSLQIKEPVDLIFEYELEGLSEVSFVIKSNEKFEVNEFKVFSCELFLRKNQLSVLGKCLSSKDKPSGGFISEFWFVGMDTHLAFQIKTVLKAKHV